MQGAKDCHRNQSYRQALSSINEIINESDIKVEIPNPIDADEFEKMSTTDKMTTVLASLNMICFKISQIDNTICEEDQGLEARLLTVQTHTI